MRKRRRGLICLLLCFLLAGGSAEEACPVFSEYLVIPEFPVPVFSRPSGAYPEAFSLEISGGGEGLHIHYTTDGSLPTDASPEYREPIPMENRTEEPNVLAAVDPELFSPDSKYRPGNVRKCQVIRAACFDGKGRRGEVASASYLVGLPETGVRTVSVLLNPEALFDPEEGIYVLGRTYREWRERTPDADQTPTWELPANYAQRGREWERPAHLDVIDPDGKLLLSLDLGLRLMGTATRSYYQKSFRLTARKEYGEKNVDGALIDGLVRERDGAPLEKMKSFTLRNGGNDNQSSMLRDPFLQELVRSCRFSTQASEPCEVYLDGEYWGLYAITEDYSDDYLADNYDIPKKNVVMIKTGELEEGWPEDLALYDELMEAGKADLTDPESYEWIGRMLDLDSFIDYAIVNLYTDNNDGIFGDEGENNWRIWRSRLPEEGNEYGDCRWRFLLYDTEYSMGLYRMMGEDPGFDEDTLGIVLERPAEGFTGLFQRLVRNGDFRVRFVRRFEELRENVFAPEHFQPVLDRIAARYRPLMAAQVARNGPDWAVDIFGSPEGFFDYYVEMIRAYLNGRYETSLPMLHAHLGTAE